MDIRTAGYTSLPLQSTQVLDASQNKLSAEQSEKLTQAAAQPTPAAVYHPSEEAVGAGLTMVAIETWIGRTTQAPDFAEIAKRHQNAHQWVKSAFETFKSSLASENSDLAEKKFGFTVDPDGNLKVLDTDSDLSESDIKRLTKLLNDDSTLKDASNAYMVESISLVKADAAWGGSYMGQRKLTTENFQDTIDLAALFKRGTNEGFFTSQLYIKGTRATAADEQAILAEREAAKAAKAAKA